MRKCPKCSATFDDLNFCKSCGAMLEPIVEEPLRAADSLLHSKDEKPEIVSDPAMSNDSSTVKRLQPDLKELMSAGILNLKESTDHGEAVLPDMEKAKTAALTDKPRLHCPKCGSTRVIPNRPIRYKSSDGNLSVYVDAVPDALIFKERLYRELLADICGDCGHVELAVPNPHDIYSHHLLSKKKRGT